MKAWRIGTIVCSGCGSVLNIKSLFDNISCYLCDASIDLSDLPVVEETDKNQSEDDQS